MLLGTSKRIIVLTGAGVSVSCGIPDFRSRDGVYARLAVDFPDLPDPQVGYENHIYPIIFNDQYIVFCFRIVSLIHLNYIVNFRLCLTSSTSKKIPVHFLSSQKKYTQDNFGRHHVTGKL